jgi:hypothetical protein
MPGRFWVFTEAIRARNVLTGSFPIAGLQTASAGRNLRPILFRAACLSSAAAVVSQPGFLPMTGKGLGSLQSACRKTPFNCIRSLLRMPFTSKVHSGTDCFCDATSSTNAGEPGLPRNIGDDMDSLNREVHKDLTIHLPRHYPLLNFAENSWVSFR